MAKCSKTLFDFMVRDISEAIPVLDKTGKYLCTKDNISFTYAKELATIEGKFRSTLLSLLQLVEPPVEDITITE